MAAVSTILGSPDRDTADAAVDDEDQVDIFLDQIRAAHRTANESARSAFEPPGGG